jgi:tetratricopeptide (TPR) repeat protein
VRAYEAGRFREAADLFHEADRLEPSALLSFNIAKAYEQMGDEPKALAAYREYLRRLPQAENRLATSRRIAELQLALQERGVQQLTVLSQPEGATLLIDDVAKGVTPWTGELVPGTHRVSLRLRGHSDASRDVDLPARTAIDVQLELSPEAAEPAPQPAPSDVVPVIEERSMPTGSVPQAVDEARPRWWTWALVGGSGALRSGAVGAELSRRAAEDGAREAGDQFAYKDQYDSMRGRQTLARVLLGVGAAAGVASGVSLYFDLSRSESSSPDVGLALDAGGGRMTLRGRW